MKGQPFPGAALAAALLPAVASGTADAQTAAQQQAQPGQPARRGSAGVPRHGSRRTEIL